MSVKISKGMKDDIAVLGLSGSLLGGPGTAEKFQDEIVKLINDDVKKVVIDLDQVSRMNSTGLGILIRSYMSLKNAGGELKLVSMNESLKGIMIMTQLNKVFDTYMTLEDAINKF
jgi:anti-sigma B factor antagonist